MQFLFERLYDPARMRPGGGTGFDLREAVRDQVQRLVWGRSTSGIDEDAANAIDFGLPGIVDAGRGGRARLELYVAQLKDLIEHYEPRLGSVRVDLEPQSDPLRPYRLKVEGVLDVGGERQEYEFPVELSDR